MKGRLNPLRIGEGFELIATVNALALHLSLNPLRIGEGFEQACKEVREAGFTS